MGITEQIERGKVEGFCPIFWTRNHSRTMEVEIYRVGLSLDLIVYGKSLMAWVVTERDGTVVGVVKIRKGI